MAKPVAGCIRPELMVVTESRCKGRCSPYSWPPPHHHTFGAVWSPTPSRRARGPSHALCLSSLYKFSTTNSTTVRKELTSIHITQGSLAGARRRAGCGWSRTRRATIERRCLRGRQRGFSCKCRPTVEKLWGVLGIKSRAVLPARERETLNYLNKCMRLSRLPCRTRRGNVVLSWCTLCEESGQKAAEASWQLADVARFS